jgi:hypothetical protein
MLLLMTSSADGTTRSMLTYADVCRRVLTYADVWSSYVYIGQQSGC